MQPQKLSIFSYQNICAIFTMIMRHIDASFVCKTSAVQAVPSISGQKIHGSFRGVYISRTVLLLVIFGLLGCTSQEGAPFVKLIDPSEKADTANASSSRNITVSSSAENRLLVLGIDGNVFTMTPSGDEIITLTGDAERGKIVYQQPTWSPDGKLVAWTQTLTDRGNVRAQLQISDHLGEQQSELNLPFAPFYYYWSPDSERLAYLSNWVYRNMSALALRVVDVSADDITAKTLAIGQPSYFSWAPDSRRMITHIANELTSIRSLDGESIPISEASSGFSAPQWMADGNSIIYAINQGGERALVLSDPESEGLQEVTTYNNRIIFSANPTSRYFAYTTEDPASIQNSASGLYVVDIESMQTREVSDEASLGFIWSPDGEKLAFMQMDEVDGEPRVRWHIWLAEDGTVTLYDAFIPSRTFLQNYLPFFDQYVQSMTMWSPDSTAFVYAGNGSSDTTSIWVQYISDDKPIEVGSGVFATWSPK